MKKNIEIMLLRRLLSYNKRTNNNYQRYNNKIFNNNSSSNNIIIKPPMEISFTITNESEVGITQYTSPTLSFSGVIKQRFSDFIVREVSLNNEITVLKNSNIDEISIKWWGQAKVSNYKKKIKESGRFENKIIYLLSSGYQAISVKTLDIEQISNGWNLVDLVDLDVQGEEFLILRRSIKNFNNKVKRIHIGTHSVDVEEKIFKLLKDNKWINIRNYSCSKVNKTIFGNIKFADGVQSWINPRFNVTYG
jgi:hypothetical protein